MTRRATIKDIARLAGVSLGSVHCALAGKPGVGEETRRRILEIARDAQYRPNAVAASLKRKAVTIAAVFPEPSEENRFYFSSVWEGVRDHMRSVSDFNIRLVEMPYVRGLGNQEAEIAELFENGELDGLLTVGFTDDFGQAALAKFGRMNIPFVLVGDDLPQSGRLCCVQPNYPVIGRILAELLSRQIPASGSILLCAGRVAMPSHYLVVLGFDEYLRERGLDFPVYKIHTETYGDESRRLLVRELERHADIAACACVNARGSVMLGRALVEAGKAGRMPAVGSDLFPESLAFLRDGVFTNLLHKNQYHQSRMAAGILVDYLLRDIRPSDSVFYVGSEVVFQSAIPMYSSDNAAFPPIKPSFGI